MPMHSATLIAKVLCRYFCWYSWTVDSSLGLASGFEEDCLFAIEVYHDQYGSQPITRLYDMPNDIFEFPDGVFNYYVVCNYTVSRVKAAILAFSGGAAVGMRGRADTEEDPRRGPGPQVRVRATMLGFSLCISGDEWVEEDGHGRATGTRM
jgi:hypothetical protein